MLESKHILQEKRNMYEFQVQVTQLIKMGLWFKEVEADDI